jgi:hypothetical protein
LSSAHLTKLIDGGLLAVEVEGRHRYYRLANTGVAQVIEELALLTKEPAIFRTPPLPRAARALRHARSCYDHLAGELAVAIAAALENRGWLVRGEGKRYEFGKEEGRKWFALPGSQFPNNQTWSVRSGQTMSRLDGASPTSGWTCRRALIQMLV